MNLATKFGPIQLTSLLLLSLQLTAPTKSAPLQHVEYQTKRCLSVTETQGLKAALIDELKSLLPSNHITWKEFFGNENDIPKGRLISSKSFFSIVYNPYGSFKKYKARGDMLKSTDTYSGTVSSQATRLLLGIIAEHDLDLRPFDTNRPSSTPV